MAKPLTSSTAFLVGSCLLCLAGYGVGVYLLSLLVQRYPAIGPFVFVDTHGSSSFQLRSAILVPGAFMGILAFCLLLEVVSVGLDNSALKRLASAKTLSSRVDLFYVVLRLAGGVNLLAFLFSFGTLFWLVNRLHLYLHIAALQHVHSYVVQFAVVYLVNTFVAYWGHRLMHTRWMWELHKVHHAAEEMNVVTPFRNHPIDHIIMTLLNAAPVALLGAAPGVVMLYYTLNLAYQSLVHSEINLKGSVWDKIWITPAAHRIHHSNREEHWDTNFGILTFWDRVFGTYLLPKGEKLTYGIDGGEQFNQPRHMTEILDNTHRWLKPLGKKIAKTVTVGPFTSNISPAQAGEISPQQRI